MTILSRNCTYPWHVFNKDGQLPLLGIPQTPIVLHYPVVAESLQQLDLTLQSVHLLQQDRHTE